MAGEQDLRGGSELTVWLRGVTEVEVDGLQEAIADLLVAHRLGGDNGDDELRSVVAVRGYDWPDPEEFVQQVADGGYSSICLPVGDD